VQLASVQTARAAEPEPSYLARPPRLGREVQKRAFTTQFGRGNLKQICLSLVASGVLCSIGRCVMRAAGLHSCRGKMLAAGCALSATWATRGLADPLEHVTVNWQSPAGCPDRAAIYAEMRRDLTGSHAAGERLDVYAAVKQQAPDSWVVFIEIASAQGKSNRAFRARTCAALMEATSLIVAMIIDPETALAHSHQIDAVTESAAEVALSMPRPDASPGATAGEPLDDEIDFFPPYGSERLSSLGRRPYGTAAVWAGVDTGSLPAFTEGFGGSLGLVYRRWQWGASFGWWVPRRASIGVPPNPNAGGELGMVTAGTKLCYRLWTPGPLMLSPCAAVEAVRWSATGNGLSQPATNSALAASGGAALLGSVNLANSVDLLVNIDALFPTNRPVFGYFQDGVWQQVFQPARLTVRSGLGVELRF
jgi:hypothetical protein